MHEAYDVNLSSMYYMHFNNITIEISLHSEWNRRKKILGIYLTTVKLLNTFCHVLYNIPVDNTSCQLLEIVYKVIPIVTVIVLKQVNVSPLERNVWLLAIFWLYYIIIKWMLVVFFSRITLTHIWCLSQ